MTWWDEIARRPAGRDEPQLWPAIERRINYLDSVPRRSASAECIEVREMRAGLHYVLRDPDRATFMRLVPEEYRVWDEIDGVRRVRDVIHVYLNRGGWFSFERVSRFLAELERNGFLEDTHTDVYAELASRAERHRLGPVVAGFRSAADKLSCGMVWLDGFAGTLAAWSGRVPWTRWILLVFAGLVAGSGGWAFVVAARRHAYSPFRIDVSYGLGLIVLLAGYVASVNAAQFARGVSAKMLGFGIDRSRFRLGWRGPAIVLDGADLPIATLRERTFMEFLSLYAQLVLGGVAGTIAYFAPSGSIAGELGFVVGCAAYVAVFLELMPFGQSAGYRLFDEWAAIAALRSRVVLYALRNLVPRVLGRRVMGRTDRIMVLFCGWCVLWLAVAARVCVGLVHREAPALFAQLAAERTIASVAALAILGVLVLVTAAYALGVTGFIVIGLGRYLVRGGPLHRPGARAATSIVGWVVVAVAVLVLAGDSMRAAGAAPWSAAAAAIAAVAAIRLVRWRADRHTTRYHYVASAMVVMAVLLLLVGVLDALNTQRTVALAVSVADAMVISLFVLLIGIETCFLRELAPRGFGWLRLAAAVLIAFMVCAGSMLFTPENSVVGLLAALPAFIAVASFGSAMFPAWLAAWSAIWVYVSGVGALWRPGMLPPFPILLLAAGLVASWLDVQRAALRGIMLVADTTVQPPGSTSATTIGRAVERLLACYGRFCGGPFAETVRRRTADRLEQDPADGLYETARSVARHAGRRFTVAALSRVMASMPWNDREELDEVLTRGPGWLADARLPTRVPHDVRVTLLDGVAAFSSLDRATIEHLADRARLCKFIPGETVFRPNEPARAMYVVVTGTVNLFVEKPDGLHHAVARFVRGDHFGEIGLLLGDDRHATARALSTAVCIEIDGPTLAACIGQEDQLAALHHGQADLVERCRDISLFSSFTPAMLRHFLSKCRHIEYPLDAPIVEPGTMCGMFYVILSGRCRRGGPAGPRLLAGDCFGHESLLVGEPVPGITAIDETELLVMDGTDFMSMMGVADAAYEDFAEQLRRRMRVM